MTLQWHDINNTPNDEDFGKFVSFELNGQTFWILSGEHSVDMIRKDFLSIPEDDVLSLWLDGQFVDLTRDVAEVVTIKGGEKFASHMSS